jgi:hypothetical protein
MLCTDARSMFPGNGLVNKSALLCLENTNAIRKTPAATASRTRWYAIALCLRFRVDSGTVLLVTTDLLSQNTFAGPVNGNTKHV